MTGRELDLGGGYYLQPPWGEFDLDKWRDHIGIWQLDEIKKADLWFWTTGDNERSELRTAMTNFWSALLLTRPPRVHSAWLITGSLNAGTPYIGNLKRLNDVWVKESPFPLSADTLYDAARTAVDLTRAFSTGELKGRIERGLAALLLTFASPYSDESILGLVRAFEGILHPNHKKQFARRALAVVQSPNSAVDLQATLEEVYDVRSGFTHAEAIETVFPNLSRGQATTRVRKLQAFMFFVVSRAYRAVLQKPELTAQFGRENLSEYWSAVIDGKQEAPFNVRIADAEWDHDHNDGHFFDRLTDDEL